MSPSSVAVTKTPIIFLGTGEHLTDLERFSPEPFISKLLGMGDMQGLMEHMQDMVMANPEKQQAMVKSLEEGKLSIRQWREQISNVMGMCATFTAVSLNVVWLMAFATWVFDAGVQ